MIKKLCSIHAFKFAMSRNCPRVSLLFDFILHMHQQNSGFFDNLVTSDEAVFNLNSEVSTQIVIHYSHNGRRHPPDHYVEHRLDAPQIMIWIGHLRNKTIRFVKENLDTKEYLRIIWYNVLQREYARHKISRNSTYWQHDEVPPHTCNASINYLREQFLGRLISCQGDYKNEITWHYSVTTE